MSFISEKTIEDRIFEKALGSCFLPLQNLPFAQRALAFVEPDENWALLFVRNRNLLSAYSTENQEQIRSSEGWGYSLGDLESGLQSSRDLETALSRFDNSCITPLSEAEQINVMAAIGRMAAEIPNIAANSRLNTDNQFEESLQTRMRVYVQEILGEHLAIDMTKLFSDKPHDEIVPRQTLSPVALEPIGRRSFHCPRQPQLSLQASSLNI